MVIKLCWAVLALIHVIPALALFKPALLTTLYGAQTGSVTFMLLHHRAALFVGVFIASFMQSFSLDHASLPV